MTALFGLALQGAFTMACWLLGAASGSGAVQAETLHLAIGMPVWLLVLSHGRQRRLAEQERVERERLRDARLSDEIFEETELDTARAGAGLRVFERYFVPVLSVALSALLLYACYRLLTEIWGEDWELKQSAVSAVGVGMVFISFLGFLIGKYAAGMAQKRGFRLLRASGGYVLGNVIAAVLIAVAMGMYYFDIFWAERVVAYAIPAVMGLVGAEILLNLLLSIYRPRVAGQETRPPYDSRLLGLFAEPEGVFRTVAATLDYQFGFKVSETWFYRFMERAIVPLVLIQLFSLWMLTTLVVVDPDEIVFIETLGRPYVSDADEARALQATVFGPGLRLKWPWPFSVARHVPAYRVHSMDIGKVREERRAHWTEMLNVMKDKDVVLWRELHIDPSEGYEASFLVPSRAELATESEGEESAFADESTEPAVLAETGGPAAVEGAVEASEADRGEAPEVNLARLECMLYFRVKRKPDGEVDENAAFTYEYRQADILQHLERLGYRAICRIAANQDFLDWVAEERGAVAREFLTRMQQAVDEADLGVEVVDVCMPAIHPPAEVARPYEQVVAALEGRESLVHEGEQESVRLRENAKGERAELLGEAGGYAYREATVAEATARQFRVQLQAYRKAPRVYRFRTYFDALEGSLDRQKLFVVPVTSDEVQIIDLQEKIRTQLLEDLEVLEEAP
jgi:regulator of protease activity HflC (stomatin/prohibitin superfamily)